MSLHIEQTELPSATTAASAWLRTFSSALYASDHEAVARAFIPGGWFKDSLNFTWDVRALNGHEKIASYLKDTLPYTTIANVRFDKDPHLAPTYRAGPPESIEFGFNYESTLAWGKGFVRLVRGHSGQWLALTASMLVDDLKGHEEVSVDEDWEVRAKNGAWGDLQAAAKAQAETNPTVLIGT